MIVQTTVVVRGRNMRLAAGLMLAVSNLSCDHEDSDGLRPTGGPRLDVTPSSVVFNRIESHRTQVRALQLKNIGDAALIIESATWVGAPAFTVAPSDGSVSLPPGQSLIIRVGLNPQKLVSLVAPSRGTLVITSNDPVEPEKAVLFEAHPASQANLLAVPNQLRFGSQGLGCSSSRRVTLFNTNTNAMTVEAIEVQGPDASYFELLAPPREQSLAPGESEAFDVIFRATEDRGFEAVIHVQARLQGEVLETSVPLDGRGDYGPLQEDGFQQLGVPKLDVLFVVDDGPSMEQERHNIVRNTATILQDLQGVDYQLGVTTTAIGAGAASGRLLPLSTPDNIIRFDDRNALGELTHILTTAASTTTLDNRGLDATRLALMPSEAGPLNPLFVRDDAVLAVIVISDRDDTSSQPVNDLVADLLSIKGFRNTNLFSVSAVAGPRDQGCNTDFGQADAAPRYGEVVEKTGGIFVSICDENWPTFWNLPNGSFRSRFYLTNQPIPETISIEVEGAALPRVRPDDVVNWAYDFATNSINFSPIGNPEDGAEFFVRYAAECLE